MNFEKNKLYIIAFCLIAVVALYYLYMYQTKRLVRNELKKLGREKRKRHEKQMMTRQSTDVDHQRQQRQRQQRQHQIS